MNEKMYTILLAAIFLIAIGTYLLSTFKKGTPVPLNSTQQTNQPTPSTTLQAGEKWSLFALPGIIFWKVWDSLKFIGVLVALAFLVLGAIIVASYVTKGLQLTTQVATSSISDTAHSATNKSWLTATPEQETESGQRELIDWGSTKYTLRGPYLTEETYKGNIFVTVNTPGTQLEVELKCLDRTPGGSTGYILSHNVTRRFLTKEELVSNAIKTYGVQTGLFEVTGLESGKRIDPLNHSTLANPVLSELYLQSSDLGEHSYTIKIGGPIRQYLVKVDEERASFKIRKGGFQSILIAPIRLPPYQSTLNDAPVPAEGHQGSHPTNSEDQAEVYAKKLPFQSLVLNVNGMESEHVLEKPFLLLPRDIQKGDGQVIVRLNVPRLEDKERHRKLWKGIGPATIIVVAQE